MHKKMATGTFVRRRCSLGAGHPRIAAGRTHRMLLDEVSVAASGDAAIVPVPGYTRHGVLLRHRHVNQYGTATPQIAHPTWRRGS